VAQIPEQRCGAGGGPQGRRPASPPGFAGGRGVHHGCDRCFEVAVHVEVAADERLAHREVGRRQQHAPQRAGMRQHERERYGFGGGERGAIPQADGEWAGSGEQPIEDPLRDGYRAGVHVRRCGPLPAHDHEEASYRGTVSMISSALIAQTCRERPPMQRTRRAVR
jgi:hypothetical protein